MGGRGNHFFFSLPLFSYSCKHKVCVGGMGMGGNDTNEYKLGGAVMTTVQNSKEQK